MMKGPDALPSLMRPFSIHVNWFWCYCFLGLSNASIRISPGKKVQRLAVLVTGICSLRSWGLKFWQKADVWWSRVFRSFIKMNVRTALSTVPPFRRNILFFWVLKHALPIMLILLQQIKPFLSPKKLYQEKYVWWRRTCWHWCIYRLQLKQRKIVYWGNTKSCRKKTKCMDK